jgi:hypothetical protein
VLEQNQTDKTAELTALPTKKEKSSSAVQKAILEETTLLHLPMKRLDRKMRNTILKPNC